MHSDMCWKTEVESNNFDVKFIRIEPLVDYLKHRRVAGQNPERKNSRFAC